MKNNKQLVWIVGLLVIGALVVAACGSTAQVGPSAADAADVEQADEDHDAEGDHHEEEADVDHHEEMMDTHSPDDHMAGAHNVPDDAAAVPNPIEADEASIAAGGTLFATNCAVCHGESGEGDGPAAAGLEKQPADLHAGHVQELSDGALFYIVSHGKPDTPMPAWENVLGEEERWQVVNFLRTFKE